VRNVVPYHGEAGVCCVEIETKALTAPAAIIIPASGRRSETCPLPSALRQKKPGAFLALRRFYSKALEKKPHQRRSMKA